MFNQDDFDEVFESIKDNETVPDQDYSRFIDYFDRLSDNIVLSDFPTANGRARFIMTSMNMMFADGGEMDMNNAMDNAADVVMSMATHLNIAVSHIENKQRYYDYLMNHPIGDMRES